MQWSGHQVDLRVRPHGFVDELLLAGNERETSNKTDATLARGHYALSSSLAVCKGGGEIATRHPTVPLLPVPNRDNGYGRRSDGHFSDASEEGPISPASPRRPHQDGVDVTRFHRVEYALDGRSLSDVPDEARDTVCLRPGDWVVNGISRTCSPFRPDTVERTPCPSDASSMTESA